MNKQQKPSLREAVVVEGRYDKNALSQVVDALIIETNGFSVFHNQEKLRALRALAVERGLVLLTDADPAGAMIRSRLAGLLPEGRILHAYIPEMPGRERRKRRDSAYGALGVEGMKPEVILQALVSSGAEIAWPDQPMTEGAAGAATEKSAAAARDQAGSDEPDSSRNGNTCITAADFYRLGLTGKPDSAALRGRLALAAGLPRTMNQNDLRKALSFRMSCAQLEKTVLALRSEMEKEAVDRGGILR